MIKVTYNADLGDRLLLTVVPNACEHVNVNQAAAQLTLTVLAYLEKEYPVLTWSTIRRGSEHVLVYWDKYAISKARHQVLLKDTKKLVRDFFKPLYWTCAAGYDSLVYSGSVEEWVPPSAVVVEMRAAVLDFESKVQRLLQDWRRVHGSSSSR